ncbi:MAG: ATP-binding protein [Candidatus Nanoarchaeia archaeon]
MTRIDEDKITVIGRDSHDVEKFGTKGAILLGKQYIETAEKIVLANKIYLDVSGAHVVFICGKRGGGKSYTMGVIAEGFSLLEEEVRENLSIILLDTMGIYWTMGHANHKERELLEPYAIDPRPVEVVIFTPKKFYYEYKKKGIRTDYPFSVDPSELEEDDWIKAFRQGKYDPNGIYISKVITELKKQKDKYAIQDITDFIDNDKDSERDIKQAVKAMFKTSEGWGLFSDKSTPLHVLAKGGAITVLDVSCYATMPGGWDVKALVVGLVAKHLFVQRMAFRKEEELHDIKYLESYFQEKTAVQAQKQEMPLVWLVIDEAHEFLPKNPEDWNTATEPLVTIMREGRQPGISLILATQQPGKIHTDVMTQSDTVISHRITAKMDVEALGLLMQSYMREGLQYHIDNLPRVKGAGVIFDDSNEKMYSMRIRPRFTWHGGASPSAVKEEKKNI